jgi:16S rRNA (guanine527-N7)-methyltransferase
MFEENYEKFSDLISKTCSLDKKSFLAKSAQLFEEHTAINDIHNLTRIVTPADFFEKHIIDSLMISLVEPRLIDEAFKIADIGCGGGFPCLPLGMINPKLEITGIESLGKKVSAVNEIATNCGISGVKVEKYRAREAARLPQFNRQFDIVTARAVAPVEVLMKECRQFLKEGGRMLFYKTPEAIKKEMPLAERDAKKFKLNLSLSEVFSLSEESGDRQFFIIQ